ncbi:translation initiation factor IF-2 [bacterium]|nr:translation initiation factor IF-2 [bacterium]
MSTAQRAPIVTILGHVDHGKTSLLDKIRSSSIQSSEAGGITQTIGAYQIVSGVRKITFIDTPGHEAFAKMRARGGTVADIIVLVIAADDGIMAQTEEAISHAKASGAPIIVAINKIDVPGAVAQKVRTQLTSHDLIPDTNGGDVITVETSAQTGQGIDILLSKILEVADSLNLKADPSAEVDAVVLESYLDARRGPVANVVVLSGTISSRDALASNTAVARVKVLTDWKGETVVSAGPSDPVMLLGFNKVPEVGEHIKSFSDIKLAQAYVTDYENSLKTERVTAADRVKEALLKRDTQEIALVVKADSQGSLEAVKESLGRLDQEPVRLSIIHSGIGGITEADILLALPVKGIVIGFNVGADKSAQKVAQKEKVIYRTYEIIYNLIDELTDVVHGELDRISPTILGEARVKQLFELSNGELVAGSIVESGTMKKGNKVIIIRDSKEMGESSITSLRINKDQVGDVGEGKDCGIILKDYKDIVVGDTIRAMGT